MNSDLYVRAGQLVSGTNAEPSFDVTLVVRDGRFAVIAPSATFHIPEEARVVDASAFCVIPGLVDAHVHIHSPGGAGDDYSLAEVTETKARLALEAYSYGVRDLAMGFVTLRSMSSPGYVDVAVRDAIEAGTLDGPRLQVAGQGLTVTGGHMDCPWWVPGLEVPGRTGVCDGPWACRKSVRTQIKWGADVIKINTCVGDYSNSNRPYRQEMSYDEIKAICDEAHMLGKRVAAHTAGGQGITDAILAGVDSVEHAHWLTDKQIELLVSHGTFYVPTLIVNSRSVELGPEQRNVTPQAWAWLQRVYDEKWDTLQRARQAGVKIAVGTDAGFVVAHGENAAELRELVKGGFSPKEAIVAATQMGAECLGLSNEIGSIETGKLADFVIVDGDPTSDISVLEDRTRVRCVFKQGHLIAGDISGY